MTVSIVIVVDRIDVIFIRLFPYMDKVAPLLYIRLFRIRLYYLPFIYYRQENLIRWIIDNHKKPKPPKPCDAGDLCLGDLDLRVGDLDLRLGDLGRGRFISG